MRRALVLATLFALPMLALAQARQDSYAGLSSQGVQNLRNMTLPIAYPWSNAQVVALGASLTGDITMLTLPAKTAIRNAYVVIDSPGAGPATLTVACGTTSALYIDLIVASDAKAAANTLYGDAAAERGTALLGYTIPSYTATTPVVCHFIATIANLSTVTGSSGRLILETSQLP